MPSYDFPRRHAPALSPPNAGTFLFRALKSAASPDQQRALLDCVDWNTPDVRLSAPWSRSDTQLQAELVQVHPLATVALLQDDVLFSYAMRLAQAKEIPGLAVGQRREMVHFSDWVSTQVLSTVCAHTSPSMVGMLVDTLATRLGESQHVNVLPGSRDESGTLPWKDLARFGSRQESPAHYQAIVAEVDRLARIQLRSNLRPSGSAPPRMDGRGRLNRWETDQRARVYSMALLEACRQGNEPMFTGMLESGYPSASLAHVVAALESGGVDLALRLVNHPSGLARWHQLPLAEERKSRGHGVAAEPSLETRDLKSGDVLAVLTQVGRCFQEWEGLPQGHAAQPLKQSQQGQLVELSSHLLTLWSRFPDHAHDLASLAAAACQSLLPVLLRMDESAARQAEDSLIRSGAGYTLVGLPSLGDWDQVWPYAQSPWGCRLTARVGELDSDSLDTYMEQLETTLFAEWSGWKSDAPAPDSPTAVDRLIQGWPVWSANPHLPPVSPWMEERLDSRARGKKELVSWVRARVLGSQLPESAPRRPSLRF